MGKKLFLMFEFSSSYAFKPKWLEKFWNVLFMSYGPGIKVIYPTHAVAYMRDMLRKAADMYKGDVWVYRTHLIPIIDKILILLKRTVVTLWKKV